MPRPRLRNVFLGSTLFGAALPLLALPFAAQNAAQNNAAPPAASPTVPRILGTVSALGEGTVTVHQEAANASDVSVAITPQTRLLRTAPGERNLKNAVPMQAGELAVGDRVLIRPTGEGDAAHPSAGILIAMKQGDITQAHQQEATGWQRHSVAGIVQSVQSLAPGSSTITLKPQGQAAPLVIHTTATTVVRHYAPDSTAFADARKSTLADIHPGDQLRARGADADDPTVTAEEIIVGSFQNIAGTVLNADPAANTLSLTDLATRKPLTLHLQATAQLRKLPPEIATLMAHRGSAGTGGATGASTATGSAASSGAASSPAGGSAAQGAPEATPARHEHSDNGSAGDMAGLLQRAPSITLADLRKGDAVMIVASGPGTAQPVAITVIAGVEPLLQASPGASANLFSASWNLGSGEAGGGEGAAPR